MVEITDTAAAKRTPSGIYARPESALADSGLAPKRAMVEITDTAAAKRTPSGIYARPESALADSGLAPK